MLQLFGISNASFFGQVDYQRAYITYRFTTPDRPEQGSEALLVNCTNFFVVAAPIIFALFIISRIAFRLLFNYSVSRLLRKFDFWGCLFITLFEGNIQQFTFYCAAEYRNAFFFSLGDKWTKVFVVCFGFILVVVSVCGLLLSFGMYRKLNKYLVDNNRNNLKGVCFLLLQYGLKNFILGVLHSVLRPLPYTVTIAVLLSTEVIFTMLFTLSFSIGIYKNAIFMWFNVIISLVRMLLITTLAFDYEQINDEVIEMVQFALIILILLIYVLATIIVILVSLV